MPFLALTLRSRLRFRRFVEMMRLIDQTNSKDSRTPPLELDYGRNMSATLAKFKPQSPFLVQIACRGQHIARWEVPRNSYPEGRTGYLAWRRFLYTFHADKVQKLMEEVGYGEVDCAHVAEMIAKRNLKTNDDCQLLEDVAALNFLLYYFPDFTTTQDEAKVVSIVHKTWLKMSDDAHEFALTLTLPAAQARIVQMALALKSEENTDD